MPLSKDEILANTTISKVKQVKLQTGEDVYLRVLRANEYDYWQKKYVVDSAQHHPNYRAHFAVMVLADEHGERIFQDADVDKLKNLPTTFLDAVMIEGIKMNTINDAVITGLEKNFG